MDPRGREVELPVGYRDERGGLHRLARLRKMTGREEELLYDRSYNPASLVTALIAGCLTALGDLSVTAELVAALTTPDRNLLLLELRRYTLGDAMRSRYRCPACGQTLEATEDLGAFQVRALPGGANTQRVELTDGLAGPDGLPQRMVVLRLPTGRDEERVARLAIRDPLRARDALLLLCVESWGNLPRATLEANGVQLLRDLPLGDRRRLHQALARSDLGVDFRVQRRCGGCGAEFVTLLDAADFFGFGQVGALA